MAQVIKFQYGNDVRRITLPAEGISYDELLCLIECLYNQQPVVVVPSVGDDRHALPPDYKLKYADEDNDFVGLTCDDELKDAFAQLPEGKILRVMIVDAAPAPNRGPAGTGTYTDYAHVVHNVLCHHCGHQVQGVRYVCVNCADAAGYSLCAECERQRPHDPQHLFLKVYAPLPPHALEQILPLPNLYAPSVGAATMGTTTSCPNWIRQRKSSGGAQRGRAACYNRAAGSRPEHKLACRFVEDITVDDGHEVTPGSPFVKIWRLHNNGDTAWPEGVTLSFVSGDSLSLFDSIPVMSTPPGAEVDVSVDMVAPAEVGRYVSNWRLRSPSGLFFGHQVWADVMVVREEDACSFGQAPLMSSVSIQSEAEENESEDKDEDSELESEWEMGRSKVRRIVKISRRSHSDGDSEFAMIGNDESEDDEEHAWEQHEALSEVTTQQPCTDASAPLPQEDTREIRAEDKECADEEMEEEEAEEVKVGQSPASEDEEWEVVPKEEWADEIAALQEMCLGDLDTIRRALNEAKGNVHIAVQTLLGE